MGIQCGLASVLCSHEDLIDFINYVFGMNGADKGFYRLLPKLYKPEYCPEAFNYVVTEDGRLRAAVGAYPIYLRVMGETLCGVGIGNVAVHPFHRRKGYMKEAMNLAMVSARAVGADFAALGGQRQRYAYFGFAPGGLCGAFSLNGANLRHALPGAGTGFAARDVQPEDARALDAIRTMTERQPSHPVRPVERLYDTLKTWESRVCLVDGPDGRAAGYFLYSGDGVTEIDCAAPDLAAGVLSACFHHLGEKELRLLVPFHARAMFTLLSEVAESCALVTNESYNVLCYKRVLRVCLLLKARDFPLADGSLTFAIDGYDARECLRITVEGGRPRVEAVGEEAGESALPLSHAQAMELFFAPWSRLRQTLPAFAAGWFPLSLYVPAADND